MNEKLREDVAFLKGKNIIKRDKEIADRTGFNKTVVSTYLSGKVSASKNFLRKFYEAFEKDLSANKVSTHLQTDEEKILEVRGLLAEKDKIISQMQSTIDAQDRIIKWMEHFMNKPRKSFARAMKTEN